MNGTAPALQRSVSAIRELFGAAACSVALADAEGEALRFAAAHGEGADAIVGVELPVGRGLVGWAAMSGQPLLVREVRRDARFARDVAEATGYVPEVLLAAPFFDVEGEVVGVLEVLDPTVDVTGDWPLTVVGTLATQLAEIVAHGPGSEGDAGPETTDRLAELGRQVVALVERNRP